MRVELEVAFYSYKYIIRFSSEDNNILFILFILFIDNFNIY